MSDTLNEQALNAAGALMMPTAWPMMTEAERENYRNRWRAPITAYLAALPPPPTPDAVEADPSDREET